MTHSILTRTEQSVLDVLRRFDHPLTAGQIGMEVWSGRSRSPPYCCRTAGRVLHHLLRKGYVRCYFKNAHFTWRAL